MACDRCGAHIEGGAYPSDDEGSQDWCFDCAVADGAKNVAEAIQCAHGRRYGEPCPLLARVKSLEREKDHANMVADAAVARVKELEEYNRKAMRTEIATLKTEARALQTEVALYAGFIAAGWLEPELAAYAKANAVL